MTARGRETSDEAYASGSCDEILSQRGQRQARVDWPPGDPGRGGRTHTLPVDGFWPRHALVVEYRELQHERTVLLFDKLDRLTVSGVRRGRQRALYDQRRDEQIPAHNVRLVVIKPADLAADRRERLLRDRTHDLPALPAALADLTT